MQVHFGLGALCAEWQQAALCVGTFDGVHLGHREVIRIAVEQAREREQPCVLVTFDRHPAAILAPDRKPSCLSSLQQNLEIFESLGVSAAVILAFDRELSLCPAQEFLDGILVGRLKAGSAVIGHDFAMGHNREGDAAWLRGRIETTVVPPFEIGGHRVSSSVIRRFVSSGDVKSASELLGRPYEISGVVVKGQQLGRQLGWPTANIARSYDQAVPGDGVYAGNFFLGGDRHLAAVGIGMRPAVGGTSRTIEAYLLDYQGGEFYGQACRLAVLERLREEQDFPTLEALSQQIGRDVQQVRQMATSLIM